VERALGVPAMIVCADLVSINDAANDDVLIRRLAIITYLATMNYMLRDEVLSNTANIHKST
jgi:hypothetical protein